MDRHAKGMQSKAKVCEVEATEWPHEYRVTSPSGKVYTANTLTRRCECDWSKYHPRTACSHLLAATAHEHEAREGRRLSFWADRDAAERQHRPISQVADVLATSRVLA